MLNADWDVPSATMFAELGWMNIYQRVNYSTVVLMFRILNGLTPKYLNKGIDSDVPEHTYHLRSTRETRLHVPHVHLEIGQVQLKFSPNIDFI